MPLDLISRLDPLRRVRCPFCFERFAAFQMHMRCDTHACKTEFDRMIEDPILTRALNGRNADREAALLRAAWWADPRAEHRRGPRRHFDWMVLPKDLRCPKCGQRTDHRLCPCCHAHLPDSVITLPSNHIAIFGPQSVGKTTFVTVLIHELDNRVGPQRGFILSPLTDEIRERYDREYHEVTYGSRELSVGEDGTDVSRRAHEATQASFFTQVVPKPLVYRLTRRGRGAKRHNVLLSFVDTAGEDWEEHFDLLRSEANYLRHARGLLFVIDPLRIRQVAHALRKSLTHKEREVPAADYLNDVRKLASLYHRHPVDVPLAIVLNKVDRWGGTLNEDTFLHELARGVPAPELLPRDPDTTVHDEVRAALRQWGGEGFLEHVETNFPTHRFFACSALGDAAQPEENAPQPLPTPILIERPVLWLMEQQKIIRAN